MRNRCEVWLKKVEKRLEEPTMNALMLEKRLDLKDKTGKRDHTPAVAEVKTIEHLRTCGPEIRVLEIEDADGRVGEKENSVAQGSNRRSDIDIEQENAELATKAEQLCRERIAVAELGRKKVVYILPYQDAGVWHCVLRTSDFVLNVSVSGNRKMKVIEPPW